MRCEVTPRSSTHKCAALDSSNEEKKVEAAEKKTEAAKKEAETAEKRLAFRKSVLDKSLSIMHHVSVLMSSTAQISFAVDLIGTGWPSRVSSVSTSPIARGREGVGIGEGKGRSESRTSRAYQRVSGPAHGSWDKSRTLGGTVPKGRGGRKRQSLERIHHTTYSSPNRAQDQIQQVDTTRNVREESGVTTCGEGRSVEERHVENLALSNDCANFEQDQVPILWLFSGLLYREELCIHYDYAVS